MITQQFNNSTSQLTKIAFSLSLLFMLIIIPLAAAKGSSRRSPVVIAVEKVGPSVVNISTIVKERAQGPRFPFSGGDFFKDFFPDIFSREYSRTSLGSGIIIDGVKGHIITNHHVVARAAEIKIITSAKEEYQAKILGSDPRSDLAVLQVDAKEKLPEIEMGNSDDIMIGEAVIAIGNPFGLSHTVTTGVVSALHRSVRTEERVYRHFIQTDASINPGNSGGPLLNIEGKLIGINSAVYQKAQGIGFAIPVNKAKRIIRELIRAGEVRFPWLGLEIQEMTAELKKYFGLPEVKEGVLVSGVIQEGPAAEAGLKRGDILLDLDGMPTPSMSEYHDVLSEFTPSDRLRLGLFRKGKELRVMIQPSIFPRDLALELVDTRLGIRASEMDEATREQYGVKGGVFIKEVRRDSEAGRVGLQPGDVILKINERPIKSLDAFQKAISRYHHLSALTIIVQRGHYAYSLTLPF